MIDPTKPSGYDPNAPVAQNFGNPVHCVKIAEDGLVYVCDRINDRIQVFHKDGSFVREFTYLKNTLGAGSTWDLALWPDREQTYLLMPTAPIIKFASSAARMARSSAVSDAAAARPVNFHWVHSIAVDLKGNVYTGEVDNGKRVQKFRVVGGAPPQ